MSNIGSKDSILEQLEKSRINAEGHIAEMKEK